MVRRHKKTHQLTGDTEIGRLALHMFGKVRQIKTSHPEISRTIDRMEREIRQRLEVIRDQIAMLDAHDRDLVTILVINGIHRTSDEVLLK